MYEIKTGRLKPKPEPQFGKRKSNGSFRKPKENHEKKPYSGLNRNRKGLKPKRVKVNDDLESEKPIRLNKKDLDKRVEFILEIEVCQVCEEYKTLDYPHHSIYGLGFKCDLSLVNICIFCHRDVHSVGYDNLCKTREEIEEIGRENNIAFKESIR